LKPGVWEVPQVHGYRHQSRGNKGVAESLVTTVYAIPIVVANPYIAGGLLLDYLVRSQTLHRSLLGQLFT
jgi:hypothetical protein